MKLDKAAAAQANGQPVIPTMNAFSGLLLRLAASVRFVASWLVHVIHYLYLSRVPLIGLAVLAALPFLATGPARMLVLGAYDLAGIAAGVAVGLVLCAVAGSVLVTARIVWSQAGARFGYDLSAFAPAIDRLWRWALGLAVAVNLVTVLRASAEDEWRRLAGGLLAGLALGWCGGRFLTCVEKIFSTGRGRTLLLKGFTLAGLDQEDGYLESPPGKNGVRDFAQGHASSLAYSVLLAAAYWLLVKQEIPALVAVFMLVALAVFFLSGLAFFLDRYRVPLLLCIAAYCSVMQLWRTNDHYYRIWPAAPRPAAEPAVTPAAVVAKAMDQHRPLVVVASAGGGIQAAAWTTAVLARIGEELKGHDFPGSVRLISGVSGGSVGGMFYAAAFDSQDARRFPQADAAAQGSSLSPAMRSLLRDDLRRAVAPFTIHVPLIGMSIYSDRAQALEETWVRNAPDFPLLQSATLSAWGRAAGELQRPALVFNATIVESGERLSFSTVPVTSSGVGRCEFTQRYKAEIAMTTAARLSATFPIISGTARPAPAPDGRSDGDPLPGPDYWPAFPRGGNHQHVVDGGYYENSGIVGAVEWLDDAFSEFVSSHRPRPGHALPDKVLFLELNAFPHGAELDETTPAPPTAAAVDAGEPSEGTVFDITSPLRAIANVRNSGQKAFAQRLLDMFAARWKTSGHPVSIVHVPIYYELHPVVPGKKDGAPGTRNWFEERFFVGIDKEKQPLSWHLRECEKEDIRKRLEDLSGSTEFSTIRKFFEPEPTPP